MPQGENVYLPHLGLLLNGVVVVGWWMLGGAKSEGLNDWAAWVRS